jgi:hypothetical protein
MRGENFFLEISNRNNEMANAQLYETERRKGKGKGEGKTLVHVFPKRT